MLLRRGRCLFTEEEVVTSVKHQYGKSYCIPCGHGPCQAVEKDYSLHREPKEVCAHNRSDLVQTGQPVCDPDLVTVCTRCGLAFPGLTIEDLLVA
jgi:hypothetical protein